MDAANASDQQTYSPSPAKSGEGAGGEGPTAPSPNQQDHTHYRRQHDPHDRGEDDGDRRDPHAVVLGRGAGGADRLPEGGGGLAEDEARTAMGGGGAAQENGREGEEEDDEDGQTAAEDARVPEVEGAQVVTEGGEQGEGSARGNQQGCARAATREAGRLALDVDAGAAEQAAFLGAGDSLRLAPRVKGAQTADHRPGVGLDDVLGDELRPCLEQRRQRAKAGHGRVTGAFAVEHLKPTHGQAVRIREAVWAGERLCEGEAGGDAGFRGMLDAEAGERLLGGGLGVASEELARAFELGGQLIDDELVRPPAIGLGRGLVGRHQVQFTVTVVAVEGSPSASRRRCSGGNPLFGAAPMCFDRCVTTRNLPLVPYARERHGDGAWRVVSAVFQEYSWEFSSAGYDDDVLRPETHYRAPGGFAVVEDEGRVVACVGYTVEAPGLVELHRLYVLPEMRREGLGERLVQWVLDSAAASGATTVVLYTDINYLAAHRLYQRIGFRCFTFRYAPDPWQSREWGYILDLAAQPAAAATAA